MWVLEVNNDKCNGEGKCADICPVEVWKVVDGKCVAVQADLCEGCESCVTECPSGAITLKEM